MGLKGNGHGDGNGYNSTDGHGYGFGDGTGYGFGNGAGDGYSSIYYAKGAGAGDGVLNHDDTGSGQGFGDGGSLSWIASLVGSPGGFAVGGNVRYIIPTSMPWLAWHYVHSNGKPVFGNCAPATVGQVLEHKGEIALCTSGLHASLTKKEASKYVSKPRILCRVECSGSVILASDKIVCTRRKILEMYPVEE